MRRMIGNRTLGVVFFLLLACVRPLAGQASGEWNDPRTLDLIERARVRRAAPRADSGLTNYRANATGYVYFFLDREDSDERTLVKVDQIALEVYWAQPNRTKQRIVGLRDRSALPNRMRYHLDHLTVVQDEFGDVIRMGDGDEVRAVPHPVAPGSEAIYDFRIADSLTLHLAGAPEPIRVYEVEVRPRRLDRPAFIGSLFLDRASAAIVRMNFTFTPASYVDPRLDYIRVSLDNGLWEGRYWLPNEQKVELRRQVPELAFPAGGVIRGTLRIGDYRFNEELPPDLFRGARVVAMPRSLRESYDFDAGLYDGLAEEGLSPTPDLSELRRQAIELAGKRYLSGLPRLRLFLPNVSSVLRYNRAESLYLGAGASYATGASSHLEASAGYATGPDRLSLAGTLRLKPDDTHTVRFRAARNGLRDLGLRPGTAGVLNTLSAAVAGEDYLDPYFATGVGLELERRVPGSPWSTTLAVDWEEHRAAALEDSTSLFDDQARFRPVRAVPEGSLLAARAALHRLRPPATTGGWSGAFSLEAGAFEGAGYLRPVVEAGIIRKSGDRRAAMELRGAAGLAIGAVPAQKLFLLGGQGTLPGYPYRGFAGDRFILAEAEASREILGPWVRLRGFGAVGWTGADAGALPADWGVATTDGLRVGVGAGLGLVYDVLRLDVARGVRGGEWQVIVSVHPSLWDIL